MWNTFGVTTPPVLIGDPWLVERWHKIDRFRKRCAYWWLASTTIKAVGGSLAIVTVIVASIAAGRPGFIDWTHDGTVHSWATAVAILTGLSGLIPWQHTGQAFQRANVKLSDSIALCDGDLTYTVKDVVDVAQVAETELHGDMRKPPDSATPRDRSKSPHGSSSDVNRDSFR